MRIVHFSTTACAGGPYRLVSLLNKHSSLDVRLIDWKRWGRYPHDLVYEDDQDKALEVAGKADVIQFHNYYDQYSRFFTGIDFKALRRKGTRFLCQLRSEPNTIARNAKTALSEITSYDIPTIVIAQFQERFYPQARVVPNAVPSNDQIYLPSQQEVEYDLLFSPTNNAEAWKSRWNTKGYPETAQILNKLKKKEKCRIKIISGKPVKEVLQEKQKAMIIVDDLVTGSYHMSGLEALCQAKAVVGYLDQRTCRVLQEISGSTEIPFVNVRLEDAYEALKYLVKNDNAAKDIGLKGRMWIDQYWSEEIIVNHFLDIYNKLVEDPDLVKRQKALKIESDYEQFFSFTMPDLIYQARAKKYYNTLSFTDRLSCYKTILNNRLKKKKKYYKGKIKISLYRILPKPVVSLLKNLRSILSR